MTTAICKTCGKKFSRASFVGPEICSFCESGVYSADTLAKENERLTRELADVKRERDEARSSLRRSHSVICNYSCDYSKSLSECINCRHAWPAFIEACEAPKDSP